MDLESIGSIPWFMVVTTLMVVLLIPPLRGWLGRMTGSSIQWLMVRCLMTVASSLLWIVKMIVEAHLILLRNLLSPRSVMRLQPPYRSKRKSVEENV